MDCVRVVDNTCYIVEIKPNNTAAQDKGRGQLARYRNAINGRFESGKSDLDAAFPDSLSIFKRCVVNKKIQIETELIVYDFCPPEGKLFNDFVVQ